MKKLVSLFLALVLALSVSVVAYADTSSAVNQVRKGVVYIEETTIQVTTEGQSGIVGRGTGFFVGKANEKVQYIVTCAHCVSNYAKYGKGETIALDVFGNQVEGDYISSDLGGNIVKVVQSSLRVYFDNNDSVEAYLVDYNEQLDIAVLRIESPTDKKVQLPIQIPDDKMIGDTIYAVGFPAAADLKDVLESKEENAISITNGVISRLVTNARTGRRELQNDAKTWQGNSGGPVVTAKGAVVGIVSNARTPESGTEVDYAVSSADIADMLTRNGIAFTSATGGGNVLLIVLIIAGALLIIGIIVLIVVLASKKGGKGGKGGRMIVGQAGALAGKSFVLKRGQKLLVGRNPDCQIRFPADTQGVSKVHCSITFDGEKVYVRDEGSSMGTHIGDVKVEANKTVTLHRGQPLYIGSKAQILVLRSK